jgi:hypothetical protein
VPSPYHNTCHKVHESVKSTPFCARHIDQPTTFAAHNTNWKRKANFLSSISQGTNNLVGSSIRRPREGLPSCLAFESTQTTRIIILILILILTLIVLFILSLFVTYDIYSRPKTSHHEVGNLLDCRPSLVRGCSVRCPRWSSRIGAGLEEEEDKVLQVLEKDAVH